MSKKTKTISIIVFLVSIIITALLAFWLPMVSYFLPAAAESMGIEYEKETEPTYSIFSDKAVYVTDDWEFYCDFFIFQNFLLTLSPAAQASITG